MRAGKAARHGVAIHKTSHVELLLGLFMDCHALPRIFHGK